MASGLSWDEKYYSPFSIVTRAYFDDHLKELILGYQSDVEVLEPLKLREEIKAIIAKSGEYLTKLECEKSLNDSTFSSKPSSNSFLFLF
jgi:hypothetical protein